MSVKLSSVETKLLRKWIDEGGTYEGFIEQLPKIRAEAKQKTQAILEGYEIRKGSKPREKKETVTEQDLLKKRMDILERKEKLIAELEQELEKLQSQTDEWETKTGIKFKHGLNIIQYTDQDNLLLLFNNSENGYAIENIGDEKLNILLEPFRFEIVQTKKHWGDEKIRVRGSKIIYPLERDESGELVGGE